MDAQGSSQTISKHIVKPSYPTPNHLKTLKLSLLDQLAPPAYMPLIFLYDEPKGLTTTNHAQISQQLKQSLSETLTLFYPIAGKLNRENFTINCNDTGVEYTEARVRTRLVDVTQNPTMDKLNDLLPMDPKYMLSVLLAVRVSFFSCGGIGIGVCLSHQIADGYSTGLFMNAWANTCRRRKVEPPGLGLLARHFPVKDYLLLGYNVTSTLNVAKDQMFVTKSFVFDKENLAALKQAATSSHTSTNIVNDPTRVELVSAFIWKHCMDDEKWKGEKIIGASQIVNMRGKTSSAIHDDLKDIENVFGNYFLNSVAFGSTGAAFDQLVRKLRDAIRRIDDEYIRKAHNGEDYLEEIIESLNLIRKGDQMRMFTFTSLSRFPLYKMDHGWGMPVCVGVTSVLNNVAVLGSTKYGDGIEVWVTMIQDNIETFETRFKLLGRTKAQSVKSNL